MVEFYQAYATFEDLIQLTEELFVILAQEIAGSLQLPYGEHVIDLTRPWRRMTIREAVMLHGGASESEVDSVAGLQVLAGKHHLKVYLNAPYGNLLVAIFEEVAEAKLIQPAFMTGYPIEVSPLARKNDRNPALVDRFELYIGGRGLANGFSEPNNPADQRLRVLVEKAAGPAGDEEAQSIYDDSGRALQNVDPPTTRDYAAIAH